MAPALNWQALLMHKKNLPLPDVAVGPRHSFRHAPQHVTLFGDASQPGLRVDRMSASGPTRTFGGFHICAAIRAERVAERGQHFRRLLRLMILEPE